MSEQCESSPLSAPLAKRAISPELLALAATEAATLARKWPGLERDDVQQEILLWALESAETGSELSEEGLGEDEYRERRKALRWRLRDAGAQYCRGQERDRRRERAAALGYDVVDEVFYSLAQLKGLVETYFATGITERPPVGRADSVTRTGDPAEGGSWLAGLVDVERGLRVIRVDYLERLWERLCPINAGRTDEEYGWGVGLTEHQVRGRLRTALRALQSTLGGQNPWNRGPAPKTPERPTEAA